MCVFLLLLCWRGVGGFFLIHVLRQSESKLQNVFFGILDGRPCWLDLVMACLAGVSCLGAQDCVVILASPLIFPPCVKKSYCEDLKCDLHGLLVSMV